nr:MAG: hypothetical protein [Lake Baikal virophage 14]
MNVIQLDLKYDFLDLFQMLEKINLININKKNNRNGFPSYKGGVFGYTRARFQRKNGNIVDISYLSIKYPNIYQELKKVGEFYKFPFKSIQVNKNLVCPPHRDKKNVGDSLLVSFGEYTGGEIIINNIEYNAYEKATIFNGALLEHYNKEFQGTKYSLVFFN